MQGRERGKKGREGGCRGGRRVKREGCLSWERNKKPK